MKRPESTKRKDKEDKNENLMRRPNINRANGSGFES